jgi:hypothetical protein
LRFRVYPERQTAIAGRETRACSVTLVNSDFWGAKLTVYETPLAGFFVVDFVEISKLQKF